MRYKLGSFTVNHWNDWDRVPRDPAIVGSAILGALGGTGAAIAGVSIFGISGAAIVGYLAVTAVTSWALSALAPKPDFSSFGSSGTLVNARDAVAPVDFVYGEARKGGVITFYESTGDENKYLHQVIAIAAHEVDSINDIYLNDQIATWDASTGLISTAGTGDAQTDWQGKIRIRKHLGDQTTADSDLVSETSVDSSFVGNGIAYLYVRYEYDQEVFANGLPLVTVMVRGKKVYDPRSGVTAYSNNAALCIRDFITSEYGLNDAAIDDVVFSAAANECDENVTLSGSGTEKRYTIDGIVKGSTEIKSVLGNMSTACAGTLFWGSGYWKLKVGAYSSPVKTLTLDDLRGPINLDTRITMRDNFNTVRGTFNDADQDYITADYPELASAAFKTEDNGEEVVLDLPLPFTTSAATAQRLAKLTLFRGREQMTINADFGLEAFSLEVGDIIAFDNDRYGFDGKEFEVVGWRFSADQQAGDLRVNLTLRETSAAAFDWNAEESAIIGNNTNLPLAGAGLAINNLTASAGGRTQGDGTFINSAVLDWDNVTSAFLDYYEVEWKAAADSVYSSTTTKQNDIEISPVVDGVAYDFRVRAVTVSGVKGAYATVQLTAGGDTTAPALPTSITAEGGFEYITIRWTNPADTDLRNIEVWENDTDAISGATLVGVSAGSEFVRSNLGVNVTKYYFLRAVDYSGNASGYTTIVSGTTTFLDDPDFENGIYSLFTDQGLYAIEDVTSLPASGTFVGEKVFNRTDGKLYQWTGSAWELVIAEPDSFIASDKIIANTITGGLLATSGIITNSAQIDNAVVTNAKIDNLAVTTIKVADRAITSQTSVSVPSYSYTTSGYKTAMSVSVNASAGEEVIVGASFLLASPNEEAAFYRILWNGVEGRSGSGLSSSGTQVDPFTDIFAATAQSGTNTLQVQISCGSSTSLTKGTAFIFEAFK